MLELPSQRSSGCKYSFGDFRPFAMFARHRVIAVVVALCVAFFIWAPTPGWLPARDTLSPRILNSTLGVGRLEI